MYSITQVVRAERARVGVEYVLGVGGFDLERVEEEVRSCPATGSVLEVAGQATICRDNISMRMCHLAHLHVCMVSTAGHCGRSCIAHTHCMQLMHGKSFAADVGVVAVPKHMLLACR